LHDWPERDSKKFQRKIWPSDNKTNLDHTQKTYIFLPASRIGLKKRHRLARAVRTMPVVEI